MQEILIKRFTESAELKRAFAQKNCSKIIEVVHLIVASLNAGNHTIHSVSFSHDSSYMLTKCNKNVTIWSADDWTMVKKF